MAVRIRLKKMGRKHRPFYRICAMDAHTPRDGKAIEELGFYDPMVKDENARAVLKAERIDYWLGVGAQPSDKVQVLIKKYGTNGTHAEQQRLALGGSRRPSRRHRRPWLCRDSRKSNRRPPRRRPRRPTVRTAVPTAASDAPCDSMF